MKYLFIGGPADGRRIECEGGYNIAAIGAPPNFGSARCGIPGVEDRFPVGSYRLERIAFNDREFKVYVSHDMRPDDVMTNLLDGYRMPNENTCEFWQARK